ncbi:MAG: hypothetical protein ACJ8D5_00370 [Sphingomicrobium sp.]
MGSKSIAICIILGGALLFAVASRLTSSANASASDCYSGDSGPSTVTICQ